MKNVLIFAAVAEAATGLALLIVPSLVGQLLLGEDLTGIAVPVARVAGIALIALGIACWPGPPLVGMLTYSALVTLYLAYLGLAEWFDRHPSVAGGRPARDPDGARLLAHASSATCASKRLITRHATVCIWHRSRSFARSATRLLCPASRLGRRARFEPRQSVHELTSAPYWMR